MTEVILHVGIHKTGSSTIQRNLKSRCHVLRNAGIAYYDKSENGDFVRAFIDNPRSFHQFYRHWGSNLKQSEIRRKIKYYFQNTSFPVHFISSEDLSLLSSSSLAQIRNFLINECNVSCVKVICFMRHPIDYLNSSLQEYVKHGLVSLNDLLANSFSGYRLHAVPGFQGGANEILEKIVFPVPAKLRTVFGPDCVYFFNFEKASSEGLLRTVLPICGQNSGVGLQEEVRYNESLSHEASVLIAEYNNRYPLFYCQEDYNEHRHKGHMVQVLRKIRGRRAELVDEAALDVTWINLEAKRINELTKCELLPEVTRGSSRREKAGLMHFSFDAFNDIEEQTRGRWKHNRTEGGVLTARQLREINDIILNTNWWRWRVWDVLNAVQRARRRRQKKRQKS